MKIGIAAAGVVLLLLGVVTMVTMRSESGSGRVDTATTAAGTAAAAGASYVSPTVPPITAPTAQASGVPATQAPPKQTAPAKATSSSVPQPSVQEIQKLVAGITAQIQAPPAVSGGTAPPTQAQIEAQVREQLKQLGITY